MIKKNINAILFNLGILILGISLIIWADTVINMVSTVLGILICLYGMVNIVNYFRVKENVFNDTLHFVYGIFILVIGCVLIFRVDFLKELISFVIGIYIVLASVIKLHEYIVVKKNNSIKLTSSLVLSIIGLVLGILCIVGKFLIPDIFVILIGYILVMYSLVDTANIVILGKNR